MTSELFSWEPRLHSHQTAVKLEFSILCLSGPYRVTENYNCVILNGAKRSEESWFYAGWEARFFPIWVRMTILSHPA